MVARLYSVMLQWQIPETPSQVCVIYNGTEGCVDLAEMGNKLSKGNRRESGGERDSGKGIKPRKMQWLAKAP